MTRNADAPEGVKSVSSTEFQQNVGAYFAQSVQGPVFVFNAKTKMEYVVVPRFEYDRLKKKDTRKAFYSAEMTDEHKEMIEAAEYGVLPD